jgi:hypothetical protein
MARPWACLIRRGSRRREAVPFVFRRLWPGAAALCIRGVGVMSKRILSYLLLACLAGGVFFTIGFQATRSPSLRVGTTIRDPQGYFTQQLGHHLPLRVRTLTSQPGGVYVYDTRFVLFGRAIIQVSVLNGP